MARMNNFFSCILVLASLVFFTEGRHLKFQKTKGDGHELQKHLTNANHEFINDINGDIHGDHSPSAAYDIDEHEAASSQDMAESGSWKARQSSTKYPSTSMAFDSAFVHIDDFRPTTPGNSPGIGH
ncbi:hypothetical protein Sjap_022386 [Stephania japonica]|uniref:Uncharacterized protein n=1 Tax=Stephania japonica TaxID=461633 RepID=A0AAP0EP87_9MAGN